MKSRSFIRLFGLSAILLSASAQEKPSGLAIRSVPATVNFSNAPASPAQSPSKTNAAPGSPVAQPSVPVITPQKLTDALRITRELTNGTVKVIVTLVAPESVARTDFKSKTSLQNLRAQIKTRQQAVLDAIPANNLRVGLRFDNIAGFSAEVTADGLKALQAHPQVVSIEPVLVLEPHLAQGIPLMRGMTYRTTYNGAGVAIAICDTGIDYTHARLGAGGFPNGKVLGGYDFGDGDSDPIPEGQAHGTCCAGIAAGDLGTVGDYIGGVAYNARLYALKISSGSGGSATTTAMVAAWDWCVTHKNDNTNFPIMVISTSFGGGRYFSPCDGVSPAMTAAANNTVAAGITVLASSGNDGYCDSLGWPSCISSVISVGAVYDAAFGNFLPCVNSESCAPKISTTGCATGWYADDTTAADRVTSYANVASFLTLMAPANQCYTTDITGDSGYSTGDYFDSFGGTSAACPYAAGAVACLQSAAKAITGNYLSPQEVRNRLLSYGDNVTDTKVAITKPRVNLERALQSIGTNPVLNFVSATLNGGNGNQSVDPNECNDLMVAVRNDGYSTATNIFATLTTATPGVTVIQSSSIYSNSAAGVTATNTTAFRISTTPSFVCGTPVNLTLTLSYIGGTNTNSFSLTSGSINYLITQSTGAAIVPGTTDVGNHGDDETTAISLPFPFSFYGRSFSDATLLSNGDIQFLSSEKLWENSGCLPETDFNYSILPHWDDLRTDAIGSGIFTSISGSAPNRIFNIEWRATYYNGGASLNFEVRLYEGQSRLDFIYGTLNDTVSSATVGVQRDTGSAFTQFECNAGGLSAGLQLTFQQSCTDGGGTCAPAAGFTASPTTGVSPLTVYFTNLSSGATNFSWDFGDGKSSTNLSPANTYSNAGSYTVSLTAVGVGETNTLVKSNYVVLSNAPPTLSPIADQMLAEETLLTFTASAHDPDVSQTFTFSLDPWSPDGASINATSGVFVWTPGEEQGPGTNQITIFVTDNGVPVRSAAQSFTVIVLESNRPPVLAAIGDQTVYDGETLVVTNVASDPDIPTNVLTFSLEATPPAGATINATSGVFTWKPLLENQPTTNSITVRVTDDAVPSASDAKAFNITVLARPRLLDTSESPDGSFTLVWQVHPGRTYRFQFKNSLSETDWTTLGVDQTAISSSVAITNNVGTSYHRFYRVLDVTAP